MPELMTKKSMKELDHEAAGLSEKLEAHDGDMESIARRRDCILYHFGCRAC